MVYLDASAIVKRYVAEAGSADTIALIAESELVATAVISRAEVAAALARGLRIGLLEESDARNAIAAFRQDWSDIVRIPVGEPLVARADRLAWEQGLRGYDSVQLAAALTWQEAVGVPVTLATFDRQLWAAAGRVGLLRFPADLP
jgi:predicted nucleic acid-binding protein